MKIKPLLLFAAAALAATIFPIHASAEEENPFRISYIREASSADLIKVGRDWRKDLPKRLLVNLRVNKDMPAGGVKVKGYFYDKDFNLIHTASMPNPIWTNTPKGIQEVLLPGKLEKGKPFNVYFALPEAVTEKKWKTILVVFGDSKAMVARSRPANVIENLHFPEEGTVRKERE